MLNNKKLIEAIKENSYIKEYNRLEKLINDNENIKIELKELQNIQQEMINLKAFEKDKALKVIEEKYWKKRNKLEKDPIIRNYLSLQEEINDLLKRIKEILEESLII